MLHIANPERIQSINHALNKIESLLEGISPHTTLNLNYIDLIENSIGMLEIHILKVGETKVYREERTKIVTDKLGYFLKNVVYQFLEASAKTIGRLEYIVSYSNNLRHADVLNTITSDLNCLPKLIDLCKEDGIISEDIGLDKIDRVITAMIYYDKWEEYKNKLGFKAEVPPYTQPLQMDGMNFAPRFNPHNNKLHSISMVPKTKIQGGFDD